MTVKRSLYRGGRGVCWPRRCRGFLLPVLVFLVVGEMADAVGMEVIGTPARREVEAKFAIDVSHNAVDVHVMTRHLYRLVQEEIPRLVFGRRAGCKMRLDPKVQSFAFRDQYYDTEAFDLYHSQASYRLRFRWNDYHDYLRHRIYWWSSFFSPTRAEIQFKSHYEPVDWRELAVEETRFEFRQESPPFNEGLPLPAIRTTPWQRFQSWAQTGVYEGYRISPFHRLIEHVRLHSGTHSGVAEDLTSQLVLLSQRHRFHLRCEHPLGSGPNPDQVFIITLDNVTCLTGCCHRKHLLELEVEKERNTTTLMDHILTYQASPHLAGEPIAQKAFHYVGAMDQALDQDHDVLKKIFHGYFQRESHGYLSTMSKYQRFLCVRK